MKMQEWNELNPPVKQNYQKNAIYIKKVDITKIWNGNEVLYK